MAGIPAVPFYYNVDKLFVLGYTEIRENYLKRKKTYV